MVNERVKIADSKGKQSLCFENFRYAFLLLVALELAAVLGFVFCKCSPAHRWTLAISVLRIKMLAIKVQLIKVLAIRRKPIRVLPNKVLSNRELPNKMPNTRRRIPVRNFPNKMMLLGSTL